MRIALLAMALLAASIVPGWARSPRWGGSGYSWSARSFCHCDRYLDPTYAPSDRYARAGRPRHRHY